MALQKRGSLKQRLQVESEFGDAERLKDGSLNSAPQVFSDDAYICLNMISHREIKSRYR
jgi:hypothetical protein